MTLERIIGRIENASILDRPADATSNALNAVLGPGKVKDALSGTWLTHPAHPALVAVPMGAWVSTTCLDVRGRAGDRPAATRILGIGTAMAIPAALTGLSDWADVAGAERRVGFVHALSNVAAVAVYTGSWLARRRGRHRAGVRFALAGAALTGISGLLGGHLAYAAGVGVDTTAFLAGPSQWQDVAAEADVVDDDPLAVHLGPVPVVLIRRRGRIYALNNRCSHRGAPLHEGTLSGDCIECPWHGSRFDITDGSVDRGPATRPQPIFQARTEHGRVLLRQVGEQRALRLNPVATGSS